jgi:hypothetical protein
MDLIPTLRRPVSITRLSDTVGLEQQIVIGYLKKWSEKDLLDIR